MKTARFLVVAAAMVVASTAEADAQRFLDRLGKTIERAAENAVLRQAERRTEQAVDGAIDGTIDAAGNAIESTGQQQQQQQQTPPPATGAMPGGAPANRVTPATAPQTPPPPPVTITTPEGSMASVAPSGAGAPPLAAKTQYKEMTSTGSKPDPGKKIPAVSDKYKLGVDLLNGGKYEEAIAAFTEAIAQESTSDEPYIGRGDAYTALENATAALTDYKAALGLYKSPKAYLGAVNTYILMSDFAGALAMANEGSKMVYSDDLNAQKISLEKGNASDSKGRVHRYSYYDPDGIYKWCHVTTYNSEGQIDVKEAYDAAGTQISGVRYTYNDNGDNLIGSWYFATATSKGDLHTRENKYNDSRQLVEILNYGGGVSTNRTLIEYGADGRKSRDRYWSNIARDDYNINTYTWTDFGKLAENITYDKNNNMRWRTVYEYDDKQQHIKDTTYLPDGSIDYYFTNEYDDNGKRTKQQRWDGDGSLDWTIEY
jgi:tetratricopeptide (TPR) repeat protein